MASSKPTAFVNRRKLPGAAWHIVSRLFVVVFLIINYSLWVEPSWLRVAHVDVTIDRLPASLDGLTIVQISDFHLGLGVGGNILERVVKKINVVKPDLVVITGDFVDASQEGTQYADQLPGLLGDLHAQYGIYAVLGNHDLGHGDLIAERLQEAGIVVLRNERVAVNINGSTLWLIGIEDAGMEICRQYKDFRDLYHPQSEILHTFLADLPEDEFRLLLTHNPDFSGMLPVGQIDLMLSGHTHGGYVRIPLAGVPVTPSCFGNELIAGLVQRSQTKVYINVGLGGIGIRFNDRPEMTVLRLISKGQ